MTNLKKIWKDKGITKSTKVRFVKALMFPVLMYGCESWTINSKDEAKLNSFEYWCWRRLLRISWKDKRTNRSILSELNIQPELHTQIVKQKIKIFWTCLYSQ